MVGLVLHKLWSEIDPLPDYYIYPVRAPQGTTTFPFAVYQIISEEYTEDKNSGYYAFSPQPATHSFGQVSPVNVTKVQITIISNTYSGLESLSQYVETRFDKLSGDVEIVTPSGVDYIIPLDKITLTDKNDLYDDKGDYQGTQGTYMRALDFDFRIKHYTYTS